MLTVIMFLACVIAYSYITDKLERTERQDAEEQEAQERHIINEETLARLIGGRMK